MDLFTRLDMRMDYNNHYSLRKGLNTLVKELDLAIKHKKPAYGQEVLRTLTRMYDKLHAEFTQSEGSKNTMGYSQQKLSRQMQVLIEQFTKRIRDEFGIGGYG